MSAPGYVHVSPEGALPDIAHLAPFRAVVIVDAAVTYEWQAKVSDWLVQSGCLYMMAWGRDCSSWDDSVDIANLQQFEFGDIPDSQFVFTTWHAREPLEEVFCYCKHHATHEKVWICVTPSCCISQSAVTRSVWFKPLLQSEEKFFRFHVDLPRPHSTYRCHHTFIGHADMTQPIEAPEAEIRALLEAWASATRQNRQDDVLANHAPNVLIYDVLAPMKYEGAEAYRRSWGEWQPETPSEGRFDLEDLAITAGADVAFATCFIRCGGTLPNGHTFEDMVRATFCLQKTAGAWVVAHQHISKPIQLSVT